MLQNLVKEFQENEAQQWPWDDEKPKAETLDEAIKIACLSVDCKGKRHSHQRRNPKSALSELARVLQEQSEKIATASDFEEIHGLVTNSCRPIYGAGELLAYDVSFRIGLFLGLEPKVVHLHAGTKEGARKLGLNGRYLTMKQLPQELQILRPCEVENFLCMYANKIGRSFT